jgi:hypothetical protein
MEKSQIKVEFLTEIDTNEISANLEYNILILGKEGNLIIK